MTTSLHTADHADREGGASTDGSGLGDDPIVALSRFVVETGHDRLPSDVVEFAKRHILDTVAVTIGGSSQEGIPAIVEFVRDQGGRPDSFLPFYGGKVPAPLAALAIGPMSRALDLGDVHLGWPERGFETLGHTAEYTLLAAVGLRPRVTGEDLIIVFALGTEVLVRVGAAAQNWAANQVHGVSIGQGGWYIFGVVAAVAKLLGLSVDQTVNAMGIAKCMTQGHDMSMYSPATLMVRVHHGFIAQDAVTVCLLARAGITGPRSVLLGKLGFLYFVSHGLFDGRPGLLTEDLGDAWFFTRTSFKPFSACKATHTPATAVMQLMAQHGIRPHDIARIDAGVSEATMQICCTPRERKWDPQTDADAQFSLPYVISAVAYEQKFLLDQFKPPIRDRGDIRELMTKVRVAVDPEIEHSLDSKVTITLTDGRAVSQLCRDCKGTPTMPFTDAEWAERFRELARHSALPLPTATVDVLFEHLLTLEKVGDVVEELILPLTPA